MTRAVNRAAQQFADLWVHHCMVSARGLNGRQSAVLFCSVTIVHFSYLVSFAMSNVFAAAFLLLPFATGLRSCTLAIAVCRFGKSQRRESVLWSIEGSNGDTFPCLNADEVFCSLKRPKDSLARWRRRRSTSRALVRATCAAGSKVVLDMLTATA